MNEWIVSVGKHDGVIPGAKWVRVQNILALNRAKSYRKPRSNVALLSGLLFCGRCGDYMRPKLSNRVTAAGEPIYTYLCTTKERSRSHVCTMKNANGNTLDAKVIETIKSFGQQSADMAKLITQTKKRITGNRESYDAETSKINTQIEANEQEIKALVTALGKANGTHAEKYIMDQIDELHEQGETMKKRLSELEALTKQHALTDIEFDLIRQVLTNVGESIEEYSVEQKRAAIRTFIRKIIWDGEHAHIYLFHNDGDYDFPAPPATSGDSAADDQEFGDPLPNFGEPSGEDSE